MNLLYQDRVNPWIVGFAAAASLLLHLLVIFGLRRLPIISPGTLQIEPPSRSVMLQFVDSPERIEPVESLPETELISDRSSLAQDMVPDGALEDDSPRAVGISSEKSIRKEPGGKPMPLEAPPREETLSPETAQGVTEREAVPPVPGSRISAPPGTESPIASSGEDEFYSPEEDSPDGQARILKQISYNMRSTEVGRYLSRLKPRVVNLWQFNVMQSTFYVRSIKTHILFKIMPDGTLGKVMVNRHEGPDLEMRYGLNAIEMSAPYEPLSEEILDYIKSDGLWLEFHFHYRL